MSRARSAAPASERPFALAAEHVTSRNPVPALLVDWVVALDPTPGSRAVADARDAGRIDVTPEAIRISAKP